MLRPKVTCGIVTLLVLVANANAGKLTVIDFNDGQHGTHVGNFYADKGVSFSNAEFTMHFSDPSTPGDLRIRSTSDLFQPKVDNPIIATFSHAQEVVSIDGRAVGQNGIRLDAYDKDGNLIAYDEFIGEGFGEGTVKTLTVALDGIWRVEIYQPLSAGKDGVVFDNFNIVKDAPEPTSLVLGCIGAVGLTLAGVRRRRREKQSA